MAKRNRQDDMDDERDDEPDDELEDDERDERDDELEDDERDEGDERDDERDEGDEKREGDLGPEDEREEDEDDLEELRATIRRQEKRLRDKDDFIHTLQGENRDLRTGRRSPEPERDDRQAKREEPAADHDYDEERTAFVRARAQRWRRDYPDTVENMSDDDLAEHVRATGDYQAFDRALRNEERIDQLAGALLMVVEQMDAMRIQDPEFDPSDPNIRKYVRMGLSAEQAYMLVRAEKEMGRKAPPKRPKGKRELDRRRPKGEASSGRRGGKRRGRLTAEQAKTARSLHLTDEEFLAGARVQKG